MKVKQPKAGDALFNARLREIREKRERERDPLNDPRIPLPGGLLEQFRAKLKADEEAQKRRDAKALREEDARRAREEAEKEAREQEIEERRERLENYAKGREQTLKEEDEPEEELSRPPPPKRAPPPKRKAPALVPSRRRTGGAFIQARHAVDSTSP